MTYTPNVADTTHPVFGDPAGLAATELTLIKTYLQTLTGGSVGYRNMMPAGNLDLNPWQRGTVWNSAATSTYTADRFLYKKSGSMVHDVTRSTDVPTVTQAGRKLKYSIRALLTTADTSIAAADYCMFSTALEAQEVATVYQRQCTLSFWVKATLPGQYAVAFWQFGTPDWACTVPFTVNAADTWEKKTVTMPPTSASAAPYTDESAGLGISIILAAGSNYHLSGASTWYSGGTGFGQSSTVNGVNTGATQFLFTDLVFKPGIAADIQDALEIDQVWRHCFRYYQKSMDVADVPGSVFTTARITGRQYTAAAAGLESLYSRLLVPMRTNSPTITWYSPVTGVAARVRDVTAAADLTVTATNDHGRWSAGYPTVSAAPAVGNVLQAGWIAANEIVI